MSIVLLEGPDGGGKTTLARIFSEAGWEYVHMSLPEPVDRPLDYWVNRLSLPLEAHTVIDRMHLSEEVYGTLFRGGSALNELDWWQLEGWLMAHETRVILCLPPRDVALANAARDRDKLHHRSATLVYDSYASLAREPWLTTELPVEVYDYTADPLPCVSLTRAGSLTPVNGIGAPAPEIVFVADRHNHRVWPCVSPFVLRCYSGNYLRRALKLAGLSLSRYRLVNAWHYRPDGSRNEELLELGPELRGARLVALGEHAARALEIQGLRFTKVPHPQAWRRFHHSQLEEYARCLKTSVTA